MREIILNNFWLKVFSIVLASLIWFVLQSNLQTEIKYPSQNIYPPQNIFRPTQSREFQCPVTLLVSSTNVQRYQPVPSVVTIRVHGDSSTVLGMEPRDVRAYVDLAALHDPEGTNKVEAIIPKEVSLRSISPTHVSVTPAGKTLQEKGL